MKKSIALVFSIVLLLTISACSNSEGESIYNLDVEHIDIDKPEQVELNDQPTKETETSGEEEVKAPEEEATAAEESEDNKEPEENENSSQRYIKYSEVLMQILTERTDPDGRYFDDWSQGMDFSKNCFAIIDIDGDGRDELIFNFNDTYMAAMREIIYDYDEEDVILRTELEDVFPFTTYYSNGYVKEEASHNHTCDPETRGIWPYYLYEYDADTDSYINTGYVECWDKLVFPTNYEGEAFPGELDTDGDNLLFIVGYFSNGTDGVERTYMDREEFEAWEQSMFPDEYKIDIEYHPMTENEITQLIGFKSQNNESEVISSNTNDTLEDIEKIREYMIPDSDGYTDPYAFVTE